MPLRDWRFRGTLRDYQAEVLEQVTAGTDDPLHIVAPPGSGKTLLGLLLAARDGRRTLALAPTVTIREQWRRTASELASDPEQVASTPEHLTDFTVLTYQMLSVVDGNASPFEDLARLAWVEELVSSGRLEADADAWVTRLSVENPAQYRNGIRRRARRVRRKLVQQQPSELARVLHPNALALLESIVEHGVEIIILDECHHLLDHWAFVIAYLTGRIRERGGEPQLIGLTATLPSPEDEGAYEIYTQLLGEVDYEVPTPAVVKAGHLAPYRDLVWFTEPDAGELEFIREHEKRLHTLVGTLLATDDGIDFLVSTLQPDGHTAPSTKTMLAGLDRALESDFFLARSCAIVLREVAPSHPLVKLLPPALLERCTSDDLLGTLGRYSLARLLTDPAAQPLWAAAKRALADFGYHLTDRGIRRGRNPIELTLATSASKDHAAAAILHRELTLAAADRIRAVVITDFAVHGSQRSTSGGAPAGALRCFATLAADPVIAQLCPILLTATHLRVRTADAEMLAQVLSKLLEVDVEIEAATGAWDVGVADLNAPGVGSGRIVAAVSELVARGTVRLLVGTRGLLGEGWDCPPVNTLIDLTAVATSSATQQLRGRSLRLDPAWPGKVAHNWSVVCLMPPRVAIDTQGEISRLERKHDVLWGLSAEDNTAIVTTLEHALHPTELATLQSVLGKSKTVSTADINAGIAARMRTRVQTYADWRIGAPYAAHEQEVVPLRTQPSDPLVRSGTTLAALLGLFFGGSLLVFTIVARTTLGVSFGQYLGPALVGAVLLSAGISAAVFGPALLRGIRQRARPTILYRGAAHAIARALFDAGRIDTEFGESNIIVRQAAAADGGFDVQISGGNAADRRTIADAVTELFGPVRNPRFLLRVDRAPLGALNALFKAPLSILDRLLPHRTLLAVPTLIGRRRADAEGFQRSWSRIVGSCDLHELSGTEGLELLRTARASEGRLDPFEPRHRSWA